jgi:hypothetical protein
MDFPGRIIDMDKYNGRVNVLEPEDPTIQLKMFERIALKNKATEYRNSLQGEWEDNVLAQVFFSAENIQIIQNGLRAGVYRLSKKEYVIPPQNQDALKVIMRSIYLQYARHSPHNITKQVEALNDMVWDYAIPFVYNETVSYMKYLRDQSTLVMPMERSIRPDKEYHQLELKPWF